MPNIYKKNIPNTSTKLLLDWYIWGEEPDYSHEIICELEKRGIGADDIDKKVEKAIKKLLKLEGKP